MTEAGSIYHPVAPLSKDFPPSISRWIVAGPLQIDTARTVKKQLASQPQCPNIVVLQVDERTTDNAMATLKACLANAEKRSVQLSRRGLFLLARLSW